MKIETNKIDKIIIKDYTGKIIENFEPIIIEKIDEKLVIRKGYESSKKK